MERWLPHDDTKSTIDVFDRAIEVLISLMQDCRQVLAFPAISFHDKNKHKSKSLASCRVALLEIACKMKTKNIN